MSVRKEATHYFFKNNHGQIVLISNFTLHMYSLFIYFFTKGFRPCKLAVYPQTPAVLLTIPRSPAKTPGDINKNMQYKK